MRLVEDDGHRRGALALNRCFFRDEIVSPISRDEIHDRFRVLHVQSEIGPALVGIELGVAVGHGLELGAGLVERRHAGVAAAGNVDRGQIERDAGQLVAQNVRDELVDLVADLSAHAADDSACRLIGRDGRGSIMIEGNRVQEGVKQCQAALHAVRVHATDSLVQHRVAEAVDDVRELSENRRVDIRIGLEQERIDVWLHLAGEFFEDEMLVFHLGREAAGLEQALAIPVQSADFGFGRGDGSDRRQQPLIEEVNVARAEDHVLRMLDDTVMLGMENVVDCGEADVLVRTPVAGDEMRVEQFVVVFSVLAASVHRDSVAGDAIDILLQFAASHDGHGAVRDVEQEGLAGTKGADEAGIDRIRGISFNEYVILSAELAIRAEANDKLRKPVCPRNEVAVGIGRDKGNLADIEVGELDAENVGGLLLDVGPGGHAALAALEKMTRRCRLSIDEYVFAQKYLHGSMGTVGLVLVDPRRRRVLAVLARTGPCQRHEIGVRALGVVERIVL